MREQFDYVGIYIEFKLTKPIELNIDFNFILDPYIEELIAIPKHTKNNSIGIIVSNGGLKFKTGR